MKKLPTVGTSAATTAFCAEEVRGPGGLSLWLDGNGKITRDNGTLDAPRPNAFSLRAQAVTDRKRAESHSDLVSNHISYPQHDCPGSTPACRSVCYVGGLEKHARATYDLYEKNSDAIRAILADGELADAWCMLMGAEIARRTSFRWHVSGDVYSLDYAQWIADVCRESPGVEHWIYTRSFDMLEPLVEVSTAKGGNLALNLSADRDNYDAALEASVRAVRQGALPLRICYLTLDGAVPALNDSDVLFPDYSLRGGTEAGREWFAKLTADQKAMVCPVDFHGKAENRRCGPCARCLT